MKAVLEGLLFLVGDDGLTISQIAEVLDLSEEKVEDIINQLIADYEDINRGLMVRKYGGYYKLTTKKEYASYYQKLSELSDIKNLSQSALETLAIIAYNEPVTRLEVDQLRGISSHQMIRKLVAKEFVKEVGRKDSLGKPILYGITDQFLDYFGLSSKEELPKVELIDVSDEEIELYDSRYKEVECIAEEKN